MNHYLSLALTGLGDGVTHMQPRGSSAVLPSVTVPVTLLGYPSAQWGVGV